MIRVNKSKNVLPDRLFFVTLAPYMSLQIGIVGLPNVGKSTLFSAITKQSVDCANFPFCTIDPNVGVVEVPDERLAKLAEISKSKRIVPTTVEFVDIAGLVKGASEGQGLGNTFLSHIRDCDAIAQVLRVFEDPNVIHVDGSIDPERDAETIEIELALADLEIVTKRSQTIEKQLKAGRIKDLDISIVTLQKAKELLEKGIPLRETEWTDEERKSLKQFSLLSLKPMLYVVNINETQIQDGSWKDRVPHLLSKLKCRIIPVCVKMESELASMSDIERQEYLTDLGQDYSGLVRLIVEAYDVLGLVTYLTSGEMETRAWTVVQGTKAPQAAGVIHTDFEKAFIRAEVTGWKDFVQYGEVGCRDKGLTRIEGKEYVMRDGDVCHFRVGV